MGNVSAMIFHPMENIKFRMQANDGGKNNPLPKYQGAINTAKRMYAEEGIISFYRGIYINMLGNFCANILFFSIYADGKKRHNYNRETSSFLTTVWISARAGLVCMFFTNPLWAVKTRVILHQNNMGIGKVGGNQLLRETFRDMYKNEGGKAFYNGLPASLMLSVYGIVQMTTYEKFALFLGYTEKNKHEKSKLLPFLAGGASKCTASALFYPLTLIRTNQ